MVLMIVNGRSGSGKSVAPACWKIWVFTAWITFRSVVTDLARTLADRERFRPVSIDVQYAGVTRNIRTGDE